MRKRLLNFINCPVCKKDLSIKVFKEDNGEVKQGLLFCSCGQSFPIIENIPRILVGDLRMSIYEQFPDFFKKYKDFLPKEKLNKKIKDNNLKKKTSKSFGYQWQKFPTVLKEWEKNFKFYFEPLKSFDLLKDKTILDAGCGNGRHSYYVAKFAKEIIAFDLSQSVDVALYNNRNHSNVHFIQADIYNLPFRENSFDFIFSIGVLHYLPTPEQGFKKLMKLLKSQAGILVYVYHGFPKASFNFYLLKLTNFFRRLTPKIPYNLLHLLCYPVAVLSYLIFVLPYLILYKILKIKKIAQTNWPLKLYSNYSFRVLVNDTFDRFSPPLEHRFSKEEILALYQKAGLRNIKILGQGGWRVFGSKK